MKTTFTIRPITANETHEPRHTVLHSHQSTSALVYPGNDAPISLRAGAFVDDKLIGIASGERCKCKRRR